MLSRGRTVATFVEVGGSAGLSVDGDRHSRCDGQPGVGHQRQRPGRSLHDGRYFRNLWKWHFHLIAAATERMTASSAATPAVISGWSRPEARYPAIPPSAKVSTTSRR